MYLEKSDYRRRISADLLTMLLAENEAEILNAANNAAVDTIKVYVSVLHPEITDEFEKTANDRNAFVLGLAISIGLYEIYNRADDNEVPEKVIKNYDDAIEDLQKISIGKGAQLNFNTSSGSDDNGGSGSGGSESITPQGSGLRRFGSQPKRTHNP